MGRKPRPVIRRTYSLIDEIAASPREPLSADRRRHQLSRMWQGLRAIETAPTPTIADWRICSDALNLMETLLRGGEARHDEQGVTSRNWWRDCDGGWVQIEDHDDLLTDALAALTAAGLRHLDGGPIRLDARGMHAVRALLEDYSDLIDQLPARTMVRVHRLTEQRIQGIASGRQRPHDLVVVDLHETANC